MKLSYCYRCLAYLTAQHMVHQINAFLPDQIQSALDLANICAYVDGAIFGSEGIKFLCSSAAKESEEAFHGIQNLAGELVVACTYQVR